jgi:protein-S-isoprenylcysteine O-methyltransferase Ste14
MKDLTLLFLIVYAVERVLETFWKRPKLKGKIRAAYSLPLIVAAYLMFYLLIFWEWSEMREGEFSWWFLSTGIIMVIVSTIGRNWAINTLNLYHSIHIEIRENHELIQSGPYEYVRNPYYLSNLIEAIGLPLVVNAKLAMFIAVFVYIPLLIQRLILEEKALEDKFQAQFVDYRTRVPMVIPRFIEPRRTVRKADC